MYRVKFCGLFKALKLFNFFYCGCVRENLNGLAYFWNLKNFFNKKKKHSFCIVGFNVSLFLKKGYGW